MTGWDLLVAWAVLLALFCLIWRRFVPRFKQAVRDMAHRGEDMHPDEFAIVNAQFALITADLIDVRMAGDQILRERRR